MACLKLKTFKHSISASRKKLLGISTESGFKKLQSRFYAWYHWAMGPRLCFRTVCGQPSAFFDCRGRSGWRDGFLWHHFLSNHDSLNNPGNNEHRIGRLGQSEKTCNAFTDFTQISMGRLRKLMIIFKRSKSRNAHFIELVWQFCQEAITFSKENLHGRKKKMGAQKQLEQDLAQLGPEDVLWDPWRQINW